MQRNTGQEVLCELETAGLQRWNSSLFGKTGRETRFLCCHFHHGFFPVKEEIPGKNIEKYRKYRIKKKNLATSILKYIVHP